MARRPSFRFSQTPLHYIVTACPICSIQNGFSASQSCEIKNSQAKDKLIRRLKVKVNTDAAVLHTCRDEWRRGYWRAVIQSFSSLDCHKHEGCWLPFKCSVGVDSILPYRFASLYWYEVLSCSLAKEKPVVSTEDCQCWVGNLGYLLNMAFTVKHKCTGVTETGLDLFALWYLILHKYHIMQSTY